MAHIISLAFWAKGIFTYSLGAGSDPSLSQAFAARGWATAQSTVAWLCSFALKSGVSTLGFRYVNNTYVEVLGI